MDNGFSQRSLCSLRLNKTPAEYSRTCNVQTGVFKSPVFTMKKILALVSTVFVTLSGVSAVDSAAPLTLWYKQPAKQWTEALPVGNGYMGAMIYGDVPSDTSSSTSAPCGLASRTATRTRAR